VDPNEGAGVGGRGLEERVEAAIEVGGVEADGEKQQAGVHYF
jgi:hypothetical protein